MISHDDVKKVSFRAVGLDEFQCRISSFRDSELRSLEAPHNGLSSIEVRIVWLVINSPAVSDAIHETFPIIYPR